MLRLNFLIYSAGWAATSGYIVDTCDYYDHHQMQCGDVCMNSGQSCICGEDRIKPHNSYQYCCVDPSPDNITQCSILSDNNGNCPQGRVLNKTEPCNGYCSNDYHASEQIGGESNFHCGDKCVLVF